MEDQPTRQGDTDLRAQGDRQRCRSHCGPGKREPTVAPATHTPAVAPVDSQNPTDHTSIGSTSTRIATVHAEQSYNRLPAAEHER